MSFFSVLMHYYYYYTLGGLSSTVGAIIGALFAIYVANTNTVCKEHLSYQNTPKLSCKLRYLAVYSLLNSFIFATIFGCISFVVVNVMDILVCLLSHYYATAITTVCILGLVVTRFHYTNKTTSYLKHVENMRKDTRKVRFG